MGKMMITGDVERIAKLAAGLQQSRRFNAKVGARALPIFEENMVRLSGSNRNKFGARGGFWNRMLSGTKLVVTNSVAVIRMPKEVRLRHKGGTVRPRTSRYLAIAQAAEAYGKSPRQFDDIVFIRMADRLLAIRYAAYGRKGEMRKFGTILFVLVRSATIKPRADVLPSDAAVSAATLAGAKEFSREVMNNT